MANYLLELGCEEIPARFAPHLLNDLSLLIYKRLEVLGFCTVQTVLKTYGTYRRLTIYIEGLLEKQVSKEEQFLGPPMTAAKQDGAWSPAALGFAKKHQVQVEALSTSVDAKGRDVLCVVKTNKAQALDVLLAKEIPAIITKMHLPIAMYWSDHQGPFFRPIHWMLSLLDHKVIPFDLFSVRAGKTSYGHRFLSSSKSSMGKAFQLKEAKDYVSELKKHCVLVDIDERKKTIEGMLDTYGASKESFLDLLEEVNWLCEYPQAIQGNFDDTFLRLPEPLLVSSMAKHQKYFSLYQKKGKKETLKASFLMVSDNLTKQNKGIIKQGNEAVLRARFNDVDFFWKQDTLKPLADYVPKLKEVVFQKGAGTLFDHMTRMQNIARYVVGLWGYERHLEDVLRAVYLSKADLVTQMVAELPAMQGFVGSEYALLSKEKACVCNAIKTHYLPLGEASELPQNMEAKLVALVDKLDLIVSSYHVGYRPTSSKDPLGLRRAMLGVLRLLLDLKKPCLVDELFSKAASFLDSKPNGLEELKTFFQKRVAIYFADKGFRKDIVAANQSLFLGDLVKAQSSLVLFQDVSQREPECFRQVAQAAMRVSNLIQTLKQNPLALSNITIILDQEQKLKVLIERFLGKPFQFKEAHRLATGLESFFEAVMVMDKDPKIKLNRLSLLFYAKACFDQLGSFEGIEL